MAFPENELPRLFERFHRVQGVQGRTREGTGIGLALVQELVKLHAARVSVDSICGAGSTFRVSVPLGAAHLPPDRIQAQRSLSSTTVGALAYVEEALRWLPDKADQGPPEERFENQILIEQPLLTSQRGVEPGKRGAILIADDNADMRDLSAPAAQR